MSLGAGLLAVGSLCAMVGVVLSREVRLGLQIPGNIFGVAVADVLIVGFCLAGSILLGASIVFNVSGLKSRRQQEES